MNKIKRSKLECKREKVDIVVVLNVFIRLREVFFNCLITMTVK